MMALNKVYLLRKKIVGVGSSCDRQRHWWISPCCRLLSTGTSSTNSSSSKHEDWQYVPVVIVGGGPVGLLLSSLLSLYNLPSQLHERKSQGQLCRHPQAHFLNTRSMELLKHYLSPMVYQHIQAQMRPSTEWECFHFSSAVCGGRTLGMIRHSVEQQQQQQRNNPNGNSSTSPCNVGHLAQNKFTNILLQEANTNIQQMMTANNDTQSNPFFYWTDNAGIALNSHVTRIEKRVTATTGATSSSSNERRGRYTVHAIKTTNDTDGSIGITKPTTTYCDVIVAADGANSLVRQLCYSNAISNSLFVPPKGMTKASVEEEQHLINIHFITSTWLTSYIRSHFDNGCPGMLHFVYNHQVVCALVIHDIEEGNFVCQIPYFPPFQTVPADFTYEKCLHLIKAGLGILHLSNNTDNDMIEIKEIRPWKSQTSIAPNYVLDEDGIVLVGDAAHVFPPAGGFGLNTGLQDVHNLAWRMAWGFRHRGSSSSVLPKALHMYDRERRPVAYANAALSNRNYRRTLTIAKALGLDAVHPKMLSWLMNRPPFNFLPLELRRDAFRQLVSTAMMPLRTLDNPSSAYGNAMCEKVAGILKRGEGLPLLFPQYELGFTYPHDNNKDHASFTETEPLLLHDTAPYTSQIRVGHRLPHATMQVHHSFAHQMQKSNTTSTNPMLISMTDINTQIRKPRDAPFFVALGSSQFATELQTLAERLSISCSIEIKVVAVVDECYKHSKQESDNLLLSKVTLCLDDKFGEWRQMLLRNFTANVVTLQQSAVVLLVRPDGHVGAIQVLDVDRTKISNGPLIEENFRNSIETSCLGYNIPY